MNALEQREGLDGDGLLAVAQTVVAIDKIGQMAGEIGDNVATAFGRTGLAHG
jgi:hypothetical protein